MGLRIGVLVVGVLSLAVSLFLTFQSWRFRGLAEGIAWLPDKSWEQPAIVLVGTGGANENPQRLGPATAVGLGGRIVLVDVGRGVAEALRHCAIPVAQPDTVLLTSLAPENTVGLDDLAFAGWQAPRKRPLRVFGPAGTRALAEAINASHAGAVTALAAARGVDPAGARLEATDVADGWTSADGGLAIRAAAAGDVPLPSLAYRFEAASRAWVVSGANPDPDRLVALATGATTLVGPGFFARSVEMAIDAGAENAEQIRREAKLLLPLERLAEIATRAGVGTLAVTRLTPPPLFDEQFRTAIGDGFRGELRIGHECDELGP
jgi:ribonuclease BN (tRNA processing enzyme)